MSWIYLTLAIVCEVGGTTCMKLSDGFTRLAPSAGMFGLYLVSLGMLTLALRGDSGRRCLRCLGRRGDGADRGDCLDLLS